MKQILWYINPLRHLGHTHYSFFFPFITTLLVTIFSEIFAYLIAHDPMVVGVYGIFLFVALIMYFSFLEGIFGGIGSTMATLAYYLYIVSSRHGSPAQQTAQYETTVMLGVVYISLSIIIGGLKQIVDRLIQREADRKRRLAAIIEQLPVGVLITDEKGILTDANKQIEKLVGTKPHPGVQIGTTILAKSEHEGKPALSSDWPLAEVFQTGKAISGKDFTIKRANGNKKYLQISASLIRNESGKIIAGASIINDITKQKETEHMKDDFINMASHELKTPLTTVNVYTHVLKKKLTEIKDRELVVLIEKIEGQCSKLSVLVGELLDVTRMQKGSFKVEKQEFYVRELAEEIIEDLQPTTNHKLILDWNTKIPVFADKERLRQVLTNLVTNAIKYSPDVSDIYIGSHKKNEQIEVYVKDFGMGIPKDQQKKIFDRFYQVKGNSTYPGLGLGLYISSQIIKQHKGEIWVESKEKEGSTFYFALPSKKQ